jgi:hypothetical protein
MKKIEQWNDDGRPFLQRCNRLGSKAEDDKNRNRDIIDPLKNPVVLLSVRSVTQPESAERNRKDYSRSSCGRACNPLECIPPPDE